MRIELRRLSDERHRLTVVRSDGARAERELETRSTLLHDLVHLAVEAEARIEDGFWGRLAAGADFDDLTREAEAPTSPGLWLAESLVGPMQAVWKQRLDPERYVQQARRAAPFVDRAFVDRVLARIRALWGRWRATPFHETLELEWADAADATLEVRPATGSDTDFVHALSARVQEELTRAGSRQELGPIPPAVVAAACRRGHVHVAEVGGVRVGAVLVEPLDAERAAAWALRAAGSSFLSKLMIDPPRRGRGWGSDLVRAVQREAGERGTRLVLDCWAGNARLRRLYEDLGFHLHGELPEADYRVAVYVWESCSRPAR
jgi:ribosomal protein S18 acetylase RimI-like enzyme